MEHLNSAFYSDSIKLSLRDIMRMLVGKTVKSRFSAYRVALWYMPDNGCPCEYCRKRINRNLIQRIKNAKQRFLPSSRTH